jgi:hypothetical protein
MIGIPGAGSTVSVAGGEGADGAESPVEDVPFESLMDGVCNVAQQFAAMVSAAVSGKPFCPV